jgi:glutathione S-transferase
MTSTVDENIYPHASGEAEKTVKAHSDKYELIFYAGWFCPFVQRTWIALEEKELPYEYREVNPYKKEKEFLEINPLGLVPAIVYQGKSLYESLVLNEFLEDGFPNSKPLLPKDSFERARSRLWIDHLAKKFTPAFYRTLQAQEQDKQDTALTEFVEALKKYLDQVKGPWFSGEQFSLADITIAPWIIRIYILEEHRGFTDELVGGCWSEYKKLIKERASVIKTSSDPQRYMEIYQRYLRNETQSEVGKAIRAGKSLP